MPSSSVACEGQGYGISDIIFVGGFPCSPFSFSNPKWYKPNCFSDPAAVPFFEMRKFIADRKPKLLILENVKGLLAPNPETSSTQ